MCLAHLLMVLVAAPAQTEGGEQGPDVEGWLIEARVAVELGEVGAPVPVVAEYVVEPGTGTRAVPVTLIRFGGTGLSDVRASVDGEPLALLLHADSTTRSQGEIRLSGDVGVADRRRIRLEYLVRDAWSEGGDRHRVTLPLLVVPWAPGEARAGTFLARITAPGGLRVYSSFPTGIVQEEPSSGWSRYALALQVVPSLLTLRTSVGDPPLLTITRVMDGAVVLLLLAFGISGWRYLRGRS